MPEPGTGTTGPRRATGTARVTGPRPTNGSGGGWVTGPWSGQAGPDRAVGRATVRGVSPAPEGSLIAAPPRNRRGTGSMSVVMLLVGIFVTGLGLGQLGGLDLVTFRPGSKPPPREFPVMEASRPVQVTIKDIGVRTSVHDVGIGADGTIEVPGLERRNEAGWYEQGPTPGEFGPAVIVGHVDGPTGPSVFHRLTNLHAGTRIEIARKDKSVAVFEVNSVERFDKGNFPVDRVFDDFSRPGLRLITCGGQWVGGTTGYADNVIVFASLVKARTR
ncbi:class F sortase [Polymorphospora sp. NPDC050346]|uniref:class F sortase n=1 Tax=Polymorphospora sp. NPDC050346 TaxID=3155780 RepID=UPI0033FA26C0